MEKKNTGIHTVYVSNLNFRNDENHILGLFKTFGFIKNIKILREGKYDRSKGVAFVDMVNMEDAQKAINALDGKVHSGRTLKVSLADTQGFEEKVEVIDKSKLRESKKTKINQIKKEKRLKKKVDFNSLFTASP